MNNEYKERSLKFQDAITFLYSLKVRKEQGEIKPILLHSIQVGLRLFNYGYKIEACIAGLLHDTIEDFVVTNEQIEKMFGGEVLSLILVNTKNSALEEPAKGEELIKRICKYGEDAIFIKAADLTENLIYFSEISNVPAVEKLVRYSTLLKLQSNEYSSNKLMIEFVSILESVKTKFKLN